MSIFSNLKKEIFILPIIILLSSVTILSFVKPEYCSPALVVATTTLCISIVGGVYQYMSYKKHSDIANYFSKTDLKKSFNTYWRKLEQILPFKKDDYYGNGEHAFASTILTKEQFDQIKNFQNLNHLYWIIQNNFPELLPFAKNVSGVSESIKNDFETFQDCYNDFILTHKNGNYDKEKQYFDFTKLWEFHQNLLCSYSDKTGLHITCYEPPQSPFYSVRIIFMLNDERRKQLNIFKKQFNEWMDVAV